MSKIHPVTRAMCGAFAVLAAAVLGVVSVSPAGMAEWMGLAPLMVLGAVFAHVALSNRVPGYLGWVVVAPALALWAAGRAALVLIAAAGVYFHLRPLSFPLEWTCGAWFVAGMALVASRRSGPRLGELLSSVPKLAGVALVVLHERATPGLGIVGALVLQLALYGIVTATAQTRRGTEASALAGV